MSGTYALTFRGDNSSGTVVTGTLTLDVAEAVVSGFDPANLFDSGQLGAVYDPSVSSTMWQDTAGTIPAGADDPVGRMDDRSGNGFHATQGTAANRPIRRTDGSVWWLQFDGQSDELAVNVSVVGNPTTGNSGSVGFVAGSANNAFPKILGSPSDIGLTLQFNGGNIPNFSVKDDAGLTSAVGSQTITFGTKYGWFFKYTPANAEVSSTINGATTSFSGDATEKAIPSLVSIGNRPTTPRHYTGNIYSLVIIEGLLSAGEQADLTAWTAEKLGLS